MSISAANMKVIVLGSGGVGKSAITVQFCQNVFVEKYDPTIEDSYKKTTEVDGKLHRLEILDTAGTDQFSALRDLYMREGDAFVVVYSMIARGTYADAIDLYDSIVRVKDRDDFPCVLVANKSDLASERQVTEEEGRALAAKWKNAVYIESSPKTQTNIHEIFHSAVRQCVARRVPTGDAHEKKPKSHKQSGCSIL